MEAKWRWVLVAAVAPITWGSTYLVTPMFLPADAPLWGAALRALPAGLLLLAIRRRLPRGAWWWKAAVLGTLNMGAFFALVYVAAQLLPASIASTLMATSPVAMMLIAWAVISERPRALALGGAALGIAGVALMVLTGTTAVRAPGVLASVSAMAMASLGYVLAKKWGAGVDVLSQTSWQLVFGGVMLLPAAALVEGALPHFDGPAVTAMAYQSVIATALAYACWFAALGRLGAGTVGLIGLLNPVTGVLLGTAVAGEALSGRQLAGMGLVLAGILLGQPALEAWLRATAGLRRRTPPPASTAPLPAPAD
ncbi:DMT family transporter [Zafaria sp. J156]|uniref:DMT family transporter n=1 Tax=Zafaria sp. J156 TaxID=3116490 RepID=UPI002E76C597|nr:EamA family transporter [Zafaria sp. J156]MEE1621672.1 EamA family transporter [Zafaria sp. J156]